MSDWFKDWFNSPEYLQVYKHRDEDEAEQHIEFILSNVETYAGYRVLDMACGGRSENRSRTPRRHSQKKHRPQQPRGARGSAMLCAVRSAPAYLS